MAGKSENSVDKPVDAGETRSEWGSDVVAETVRALGFDYMALVPGASFRGLHDSIVNHLGNRSPQMVVCLHEGVAVSIADGYAKVTETPMLVGLHANVGVMNGSMGVFNAWCDRSPMVILGATGPVDAHKRRPWIDWVHTSRDQGALIRDFIKWDDQPASAEAAVESLLRANQIARMAPFGPTYICLDVAMQEAKLERDVHVPDANRFAPAPSPAVPATSVTATLDALKSTQFPVLLMGRMSRKPSDWDARLKLAELIGAPVLTSIHNPTCFPLEHPLHVNPLVGEKLAPADKQLLAKADLIISFDWLDLAGFLRAGFGASQSQQPVGFTVINASLDGLLTNGWSMDHQALPAVDIPVQTSPDTFAATLLEALTGEGAPDLSSAPWRAELKKIRHWTAHVIPAEPPQEGHLPGLRHVADVIGEFCENHETCVARLPIGWPSQACRFSDPLAYLGKDGGAAVGTGPAHVVGAALALKDSAKIVLGVVGDGDFLMGCQALWTASHMQLPMLLVVTNNRSYFNDERHQEAVAITRGRPVENKWIGQALDNPAPDLVAIARAQGFDGIQVKDTKAFAAALERGASVVQSGGRYLIDCRIEGGYVEAVYGLG